MSQPQSSLTMVPVPLASRIPALVGDERFRVKVSLASLRVSPLTGTITEAEVLPAAMVTVPLLAVRSAAVAVPKAVAYFTVIGLADAADSFTLKVRLAVPESGSGTGRAFPGGTGAAPPC